MPSRFFATPTSEGAISGCYWFSQPPIRPEEQRGAVHLYVKSGMGSALELSPRSTQDSAQPLTHLIVVSPLGASTVNSNAGADVCALPIAQPARTRTAATTI